MLDGDDLLDPLKPVTVEQETCLVCSHVTDFVDDSSLPESKRVPRRCFKCGSKIGHVNRRCGSCGWQGSGRPHSHCPYCHAPDEEVMEFMAARIDAAKHYMDSKDDIFIACVSMLVALSNNETSPVVAARHLRRYMESRT